FIARSIMGSETRGIIRGILGSVITVAVSYAFFPLAPGIWIAALLVFCAHLGGGAQWFLSTFGLQRAAPDEIRRRVFSFAYGLVPLSVAVSTLLSGFLAETFSPAIAVWTMVALIAVAASAWFLFTRPILPGPYDKASSGTSAGSEPDPRELGSVG